MRVNRQIVDRGGEVLSRAWLLKWAKVERGAEAHVGGDIMLTDTDSLQCRVQSERFVFTEHQLGGHIRASVA